MRIFLAFSDWLRVADQDLEQIRGSDVEDPGEDEAGVTDEAAFVRERAHQFVRCMNALVDSAPDILHVQYLFEPDGGAERRFWLGTLFTGTAIDFTQSASQRGKEVLFWVVANADVQGAAGTGGGVGFWGVVGGYSGRGPQLHEETAR